MSSPKLSSLLGLLIALNRISLLQLVKRNALVIVVLGLALLVLHPGIVDRTCEDDSHRCSTATSNGLMSIETICEKVSKTYVVITSWNSHMPRREAATPRTADETIWVMGEVTLIESKLAILIRKPKRPFKSWLSRASCRRV